MTTITTICLVGIVIVVAAGMIANVMIDYQYEIYKAMSENKD